MEDLSNMGPLVKIVTVIMLLIIPIVLLVPAPFVKVTNFVDGQPFLIKLCIYIAIAVIMLLISFFIRKLLELRKGKREKS